MTMAKVKNICLLQQQQPLKMFQQMIENIRKPLKRIASKQVCISIRVNEWMTNALIMISFSPHFNITSKKRSFLFL